MDNATNLVTTPYVDVTNVETVLLDIAAVLRKHGCILIHMGEATVLAKITSVYPPNAVHIAAVHEITPERLKYKPAWRPAIERVTG